MINKFSIIAAGDLAFAQISEKADYNYAKWALEEIIPVLSSADYSLVNLENPLTERDEGIEKTGPCLKGEPENVSFIKGAGFDCAVLANNHIGDYGPGGVTDTIKALDENGIAHIGAGEDLDEAYKPIYIAKNEISVGIFAVAENEFGGADNEKAGMAGFNISRVYGTLKEIKSKADYAVIIFHGGCEYNPLPSPAAKERYRLIADMGADAVIAMHTHCEQGYEVYGGVPIVYSTGNFWFRSRSKDNTIPWFYGYLPKITFTKGGETELEIIPYHLTESFGKLELLKGEAKKQKLSFLNKLNSIIQDDALLKDYFKGWAVISGLGYSAKLGFDREKFERMENQNPDDFLFCLNDFTCESHSDVVRETLKIVYNNEYEKAFGMAEKIKELQNEKFSAN